MTRFEIFPAIDVAGDEVARLAGREVVPLGADPVGVARGYVAAGARWVHVVDLEAAIGDGSLRNRGAIEAIASLGIHVQAGGGLSPRGVVQALDAGASRAVLGAAWMGDLPAVERTVTSLGRRVGVGLDVAGGAIRPRGSSGGGPALDEVLDALAGLQPAFAVYANVEREGSMGGPDVHGLTRVAAWLALPVLASGGVRSTFDVAAARRVQGCAGVVIGRALLEGTLTMAGALAAAEPA